MRVPAKLLAPIVVPFLDDYHRTFHPVWGCDDTTDLSYYNIAIRNGAHNFGQKDSVNFVTYPEGLSDPTLEKTEGFQWRFRRSKSGNYLSFRATWGKPRPEKGKKEFYIGWTMNESPKIRPTLQLRPF